MNRVTENIAEALARGIVNRKAAEEGIGQLMMGVTSYWDSWLPKIKANAGPKDNMAKLGLKYEDVFVRSTMMKIPPGPSSQSLTITNRTGKRLKNVVVMIESQVCSGKKGERWYFYFPFLSSSAKLSPDLYDAILKPIPQLSGAGWLSREFSNDTGEGDFTISLWCPELSCENLVLSRSGKIRESTKTKRERGIITVVTETTTRSVDYLSATD